MAPAGSTKLRLLSPFSATVPHGLTVAEGLAKSVLLADRIDIFEIEQFVALNLYELENLETQAAKPPFSTL
jgi:hypothetical protein